ncbi:MAG: hypothetical protein ACRD52_00585 [Candidatus Acidiferrales bacterium]
MREKLERNNAADRYYAAMAGVAPRAQSIIPPKRIRKPSDPSVVLEKHVLNAVSELLAAHPLVLFAIRQNSGAMSYERDGREIPVFFYKILRSPEALTVVDFTGLLRDGRAFALEAKRESWRGPSTEREHKQAAYLRMIECIGGVAGFVRSADEARSLLACGPSI